MIRGVVNVRREAAVVPGGAVAITPLPSCVQP